MGAIQDIVPSESQIKEKVETYGALSQNITGFDGKKKKATKSRDSSISRVQETVLPIEVTKSQVKTTTETEMAVKDMVPLQPQEEQSVQICGSLSQNIVKEEKVEAKASRSRENSLSRVQETI